ncbi:Phytoene synthase [Frankia sp. AiPs1]|uniref:phytoene/squalene synthase family protein n=1 Tax=Frankia sp. AiPa1 TaxID=573492 RepID=UPI00202B69E5|nr:phytoene/squalene synthase family protein [Frankia sp. AiPa1]MCL9757993.1 phytoene/squalene synthase family protein [Frankia sp. AiPa1]
MRELDAAGITEPCLRASYVRARELHAANGRTYFLATLLLPPWKRPHVNALYGFARYADDLVDDLDARLSDSERAAALRAWAERFLTALRTGTPADDSQPPTGEVSVLPATIHTIRRFALDPEHFASFLASMAMDLTVTEYATWQDLLGYMHGSAAVIGLQMVPLLEPIDDSALPYARDLGLAFQLANFIRDVGEDLRRGRVYLPAESLDLFGVTRERLAAGVVDGPVRRLLAFEISRARELFRCAEPGIRLLHPTSRDCVRTAFVLYRAILDEVERADYQVLDRRVSVATRRRLAVAGPALLRARQARRRDHATTDARAVSGGRAGAQRSSRPPR